MTRQEATEALNSFLRKNLPVAEFMGLEVAEYTGDKLSLKAPLALNINDKLTAFGGSLYNVSVMCCWGALYIKMLERGHDMNQVVAKGEIRYFAPVHGDLIATCVCPSDEEIDQYLSNFFENGKTKITASCTIECTGKTAVKFEGLYSLVPHID